MPSPEQPAPTEPEPAAAAAAPAQSRQSSRPPNTLRETRFADPQQKLSPMQISRLGISESEFRERAAATEAARAVYEAALYSPETSTAERHNLAAQFATTHGKAAFKCPGCWLLPGCCVCAKLTRGSTAPHQLGLYLHHKEHGRGSNTGVLLCTTLGAEMYVSGREDDEKALAARLEEAGPSACVLWPGDESLSLAEFMAQIPEERRAEGVFMLAMDATWGSARKMVNRLPPTLTKVKLDADSFGDGGFSLLRPVRKYDGDAAERYCTFEAACAALLELGVWGPPQSEQALAQRAKQLVNLKAKVDGLLIYKNRSTVYSEER